MSVYRTIIALYALLSAWILGVHKGTGKASSSLTGDLTGLAASRQGLTRSHVPDARAWAVGLSDGPGDARTRLGRVVGGRLDSLSESLRTGTKFLGKSLDSWPVSMVESAKNRKRTNRTFRKSPIYHHIVGYIRIYHPMSEISSFIMITKTIRKYPKYRISCFMFRDSRHRLTYADWAAFEKNHETCFEMFRQNLLGRSGHLVGIP